MKRIIYLTILGFFLVSCIHKEAKKNELIKLDSLKREELKITIINDSLQTNRFAKEFISFWIPTYNQIDTINSIIRKAIKANNKEYDIHLKPDSLKSYYRQYVCYTEANGDSIAFINAFLKIDFRHLPGDGRKRDDWQYYLIRVKDGGEFYWHIKVNLTKKKYYNFVVNGDA